VYTLALEYPKIDQIYRCFGTRPRK